MEKRFEENGLIYSDETKKVLVDVAEDFEEETELIIPEGVETIEAGALSILSKLQKLTLPSTLKMVGCNYLYDPSLEVEIIAPVYESLTLYGHDYFENYGNLPVKKVILKAHDNSIEGSPFLDWTTLEEVVVEGDLDYIGNSAFAGCTNLKSVTFEGSVGTICCEAFEGCNKLEEINIPGETEVEDGAFDGKNTWRNKWVDLGLPSGTLWARSNFGTNNPSDIGIADSLNVFFDRGLIASMPNYEQMSELISLCKWEEFVNDNKISNKVTGVNGNSVLLPCRSKVVTGEGFYWTKTGEFKHAYYLSVRSKTMHWTNSQPCNLFATDGILPGTLRQVMCRK